MTILKCIVNVDMHIEMHMNMKERKCPSRNKQSEYEGSTGRKNCICNWRIWRASCM